MNKAGRMQNLRRLVWLPKRCSSANQNANSTENRAVNLQLLPRDRIRNIGIVAHVDAGKTTVTEQLLFLTGATRVVGNVDAGNTVTDFLDMERERGITIQSAAVSFDWLDHRINLIDTPGHVDFTVEVERCVRVLDGVVAVLDASAGVQAQTLTVWKQASKYGLPSAFFVNKLDKKGANFGRCVNDVEQKLGVKAMCTVVPHTRADGSLVLVDLLNGNAISMSSRDASWTKIEKPSTRESDVLEESRSDLFYALADVDDVFMAHFLDECGGDVNRVDHDALIGALRGATVSGSAATVSCGSALKSTNCTRTILDHVVQFLPSPSERHGACASIFDDQFAGLVFKVTHEKRKGKLSYIRVYNGSLKSNTSVFNSSQGRSEGPVKIFHAYADELRPMDRTGAGSIAVVSGLHHAVTGDTLLTSESAGKKAYHTFQEVRGRLQNAQANEHDHHRKLANQVATATADQQILDRKLAGRLDSVQVHPKTDAGESTVVFAGIDAPESVYFCNVEPPSSRKMHEFESALNELAMETCELSGANFHMRSFLGLRVGLSFLHNF